LRVRWLRRALLDLEAVEAYIAQDDPDAAAGLVLRVVQTVSLLKEQPGIGRSGRLPNTRELIVPDTPYIVPYRVKGDTVQILRVYHSSRKWPDCL
jgi:addiction module RelE/StbE family toxin